MRVNHYFRVTTREINNDGMVTYNKQYHPGWETMPRCNTITLISTSNRITILPTETLA